MRCTTISTIDNNVSDGTRSSQIVISEGSGSTVPIEVYPSRIPLTILDNDGKCQCFIIIQINFVHEYRDHFHYHFQYISYRFGG